VCRLADITPGEIHAFSVAGVTWPVIVTYLESEIVATAGVCPHEDVGLANGYLDGETLVCPGHAYGFDLRTGKCRHDASLVLRRYAVTLVGDEVWVDLL
jgi:nitrite reductase/ring-hydroxylating ferredoxin subunit